MKRKIEISALYEKYTAEYERIYSNRDDVDGFHKALKSWDAFCESDENTAFLREFCAYMGDYITSDREAVAFMFALEALQTAPTLELKRLKNVKFGYPNRYVDFTGWALYDKESGGYAAFSAQRDKYGILLPYFPCGGKKALQKILDDGGFIHYNGIEFVKPMAA